MDTLEEYVRARVSAFLESTGVSPTRFGRMAVGDPHLVRRYGAWPLADAVDGGPGSGVHRRPREGLGRRAGSARPSPLPEAIESAKETEEEHSEERPAEG